jgi:hypothetical protein
MALRLLAEARTDFERRALRAETLAAAAASHVEALAAQTDYDNPDACLLLGAARISNAWKIRGGSYARYVGSDRFQRFWAELELAREPLQRAAVLFPEDPVPWNHLQWYGLGIQVGRQELDRMWAELQQRDPTLFAGHQTRIQVIAGKWKGSPREVADFAAEIIAQGVTGNPLVALAATAHFENVFTGSDEAGTDEQARQAFCVPEVAEQIHQADKLWADHPRPHPYDPEAHHLLGAAFYYIGDYARARDHLAHTDRRIPRIHPWMATSVFPGLTYLRVRKKVAL